MKKSSVNTKNILTNVNNILGISDSYQAPDRVMQIMLDMDEKERKKIYLELAELFEYDYSKDWFFEYFQEEHADRHQNKQDFTPPCIAGIIHYVLQNDFKKIDSPSIIYEPASGTGQMIIRDWDLTRRNNMPWDYKPMDHLVICCEFSIKTIPFLLLNLSIRGICGMVFHMNTLTNEIFNIYILTNHINDSMCYSEISRYK